MNTFNQKWYELFCRYTSYLLGNELFETINSNHGFICDDRKAAIFDKDEHLIVDIYYNPGRKAVRFVTNGEKPGEYVAIIINRESRITSIGVNNGQTYNIMDSSDLHGMQTGTSAETAFDSGSIEYQVFFDNPIEYFREKVGAHFK